jgi:hypothetical protein
LDLLDLLELVDVWVAPVPEVVENHGHMTVELHHTIAGCHYMTAHHCSGKTLLFAVYIESTLSQLLRRDHLVGLLLLDPSVVASGGPWSSRNDLMTC